MAFKLEAAGVFRRMPWRKQSMSIEKRQSKDGPLYRFDIMVHGVRLKSRFIFASKRKALEVQAEAVTDYIKTGKLPTLTTSPAMQKTVLQLLNERIEWLKANRSKEHAKNTTDLFRRGLGYAPKWAEKPIGSISLDMVREWATKWKFEQNRKGFTAKEVNDALMAFQAAWNHPWDSKRAPRTFPDNPFAQFDRFAVEEQARYVPETSMIDKILLAAQEEEIISLFLTILSETAARPGEPLKLSWQDFSRERRTLDLRTAKNQGGQIRARKLAISGPLAEKLALHHQNRPASIFVFQRENSEKVIAPRTIVKWHREICAKAGVKHFDLYCWRHWRASKWDEEGLPLTTIQDRLGHSTAAMTSHYLHSLRGR